MKQYAARQRQIAIPEEVCQGFDGPCKNPGIRYHQRTQYSEEESNWVTLCPECRKVNDAFWDEMWADLYSGIG